MPDYYPLIQAARKLRVRPWALLRDLKSYFTAGPARPAPSPWRDDPETGGSVADVPAYWPLVQAAAYLGVRVKELQQQPMVWRAWALICESAEAQAAKGPVVEQA